MKKKKKTDGKRPSLLSALCCQLYFLFLSAAPVVPGIAQLHASRLGNELYLLTGLQPSHLIITFMLHSLASAPACVVWGPAAACIVRGVFVQIGVGYIYIYI